ncbi:MAG TPA: MFS transporter [Clostridia bacterium]
MDNANSIKRYFNNPFISLRHKNFAYYWVGMCISLVGTWMQNTAQSWLAYNLTKSPFLLSLIGALQFVPSLFFSLFAGVFVDRFSKKRILIFTQAGSLVITFMLALLVMTGTVRYWHILASSIALGFVNTLDTPARQSFVIELVGKKDLMNAVSLNSSVFNAARIIGSFIAGMIMGYFGIAFCFFANSISFGAVLISLLFVKPTEAPILDKKTAKVLPDVKEGIKFILKQDTLLYTVLLMAVIGTFAMNLSVSVPLFAKDVLKLSEKGFGFLMSFTGIGSFLGAMMLAIMSKSGPQKFITNVMPLTIAVLLILAGFTNSFIAAGLCLSLIGFCFVSFSSNANSTMQLNSKDEYRGRVMSVFSLVFMGTTPIGNLYTGILSERFGARFGIEACGAMVLLLLVPIYFYRMRNRHKKT